MIVGLEDWWLRCVNDYEAVVTGRGRIECINACHLSRKILRPIFGRLISFLAARYFSTVGLLPASLSFPIYLIFERDRYLPSNFRFVVSHAVLISELVHCQLSHYCHYFALPRLHTMRPMLPPHIYWSGLKCWGIINTPINWSCGSLDASHPVHFFFRGSWSFTSGEWEGESVIYFCSREQITHSVLGIWGIGIKVSKCRTSSIG